jgi:enoyl-CoA hydratase/carnithine racemase
MSSSPRACPFPVTIARCPRVVWQLVGRQHAIRLLASGAPVSAATALSLGLADAVSPATGAGLLRSADAFAAGFLPVLADPERERARSCSSTHPGGPPGQDSLARAAVCPTFLARLRATRAAKAVVGGADDARLEDALANEARIFGSLWGQPESLACIDRTFRAIQGQSSRSES